MIDLDLHTGLLDLAHAIAPELREAPLYLVDDADLQRAPAVHAFGYAPQFADPALRDHLIASGEWRGPGRQIVLCTGVIRAAAGDDPEGESFRRRVESVFVHELAHSLEAVVPAGDHEPTPAERELSARTHAALLATERSTEPSCDSAHGAAFIRRCVHLWQRSLWSGKWLELWPLCAGDNYGLSDARTYAAALADEPYRLRAERFDLIDKVPPPAAFTALWHRDKKKMEST